MVHQSQSSTFSYTIHLLFFSSQIKKTLTRMITFINECWKSSFLNRVKTDHQDWVRLILSLWSVKLKLKSSGSRIEPCGAPCEMFVYDTFGVKKHWCLKTFPGYSYYQSCSSTNVTPVFPCETQMVGAQMCPQGWTFHNGRCYTLSTEHKVTWSTANRACRERWG